MAIHPYSDNQWDTLSHTVLTSDAEWDPSIFDTSGDSDDETWYDAQTHLPVGPFCPTFNEFGEVRNAHIHETFISMQICLILQTKSTD